ncbi:ABC transporter substrate-binding protein [Chitinimonas sp. BJYL2]|uniref:ABC transporter substrate-binding protein n=1 Tax=Chitinimonas sp. BJYL2 TaxID=2976696 RepID=UPI0022B2D0B6|nr:ABC transporter substrate-binding protein [Chitinimonas sp. BJYL2]
MNRRNCLHAGVALGLAPWLNAATTPTRRVMLLLYRGVTPAERGFMDYLKRQMPVEFIVRDAAGDKAKLADLVAEARTLRPDLIYAFGTTVTIATVGTYTERDPARHISDIPVVFNIVADPVGAGLAPDTKSSLRNLTGVSHLAPPTVQWQAMRRYGRVSRLGLIYSPNEKNAVLAAARLAQAAKADGVSVHAEAIETDTAGKPDEAGLSATLARVLKQAPDWLYLPSDSFLIAHAAEVVSRATEAGVATFAATEEPVRQGGALAGLVSPYYAAGQFAGLKAAQILQGTKTAADLPLDTLARFTYLMNMTTARQLGRFPPIGMLRYAEVVGA